MSGQILWPVVIPIARAFTHRAGRLSDRNNQTCLILVIRQTTGLKTVNLTVYTWRSVCKPVVMCQRPLIVVIYCPSRGSDSVRSTVNASFQIIPRLVGRLGSEVRDGVSFQSFALRVRVSPVMFLPFRLPFPVPERTFFLSHLSCHVLGRPHNGAVVRRCLFSTDLDCVLFYVHFRSHHHHHHQVVSCSVCMLVVVNQGSVLLLYT